MIVVKRIKTVLITSLSITVLLVILLFAFLSPLSKYLVQKYDQDYLGREITLDKAYVNPFTGFVYFSNVKIYEPGNDSIFLSVKGLSANFTLSKLPFKTYEISELKLNQPKGIILQNGDKHELNFNDIIEKFKPKNESRSKSPVKFSILSIQIEDGEFYYRENIIPINYSIKKVNINCSGLRWDSDTIGALFTFISGTSSGQMKGNFSINTNNLDYHFNVKAIKYDLDIIGQYLKDLTNYGTFSANLDADMHSNGNFKDNTKISNSGMLALNAFHFGKNKQEDYASFEKLVLAIKEVTPGKYIYSFDSVSLIKPYLKYERYDYLDNLQVVFGKKGSRISTANETNQKFNLVIEIGKYIKEMSRNLFKSRYKLKRLAIYKGNLEYSDYSVGEKFSVQLSPFNFSSDSISKEYKLVSAELNGKLKPYGSLNTKLSINPNDSSDFDIFYNLQNIPLALFNPYVISASSFPLNKGTLEINGQWHVRNSIINSKNHLLVIDPRVGNRLKTRDNNWLPARFILFFLREQGNVIDYEIPITGNLKNPKFRFRDVILDALENTFVKPLTTPYRITVKKTESEIEHGLAMSWNMNSNKLDKNEVRFLKKTADYLSDNPGSKISVYPLSYEIKEKEHILLFEAKKNYYLAKHDLKALMLNQNDTDRIQKISIKDSSFIHYLNLKSKSPDLYTTQGKSADFVSTAFIQTKYNLLNSQRKAVFLSYFRKKGVEGQVQFYKEKKVIPFNGFSVFKITYNDILPEALIKAYNKMNQLNNEPPRAKFKLKRHKNSNKL